MLDPKICKRFLEVVLGIKIKLVKYVARQKYLKHRNRTKGIFLDISVVDENGLCFDIEMQVRNDGIPKRSRYYQGSMDIEVLEKGLDYDDLKPAYVIFICTFDLFGEEAFRYDFEYTCRQFKQVVLGDEAYRIFLNTKGKRNNVCDELREFLQYVDNSTNEFARTCSGKLVKMVHKKVEEVRRKEEKGFMTYSECVYADGKEEGKEEMRRVMAEKLLKQDVGLEIIENATEYSRAEIEVIKKEMLVNAIN